MKNPFREGDEIEMIEGCGSQKTGMRLKVQKHPTENMLFVNKDNLPYTKDCGLCSCPGKWRFISHAEVTDWEKELEVI